MWLGSGDHSEHQCEPLESNNQQGAAARGKARKPRSIYRQDHCSLLSSEVVLVALTTHHLHCHRIVQHGK